MASVMVMPNFLKHFRIVEELEVYTIIITTMMIGAVVGALLGGPLADFLGRRGLAIFGSLLCMLGNLLLVAADEMAKIYAGRTLVGISVG